MLASDTSRNGSGNKEQHYSYKDRTVAAGGGRGTGERGNIDKRLQSMKSSAGLVFLIAFEVPLDSCYFSHSCPCSNHLYNPA